jgi:hypothetical protein
VLEWLCCPYLLSSSCRTAKRLVVAGWLPSIRFLHCVLPLLQSYCLVFYFDYMRLSSKTRYILAGMGMHWLEYVIEIV